MLIPHYPPDLAADGQLFALLARELAGHEGDVRVATYRPGYQETQTRAPRRETVDRVDVSRLWSPRSGKRGLLRRALVALWMTNTAFWRAALRSRKRVLLIPSSPPTLGLVGWLLHWLKRQRYIYVLHDIHPDLGIALGRLRARGPIAWILRRVNRLALRRAHCVVTPSEAMKRNALKIQPKAHVEVIENWVDLAAIQPTSEEPAAERPAGSFVIQYSGNLGLLHPLDALTRAAGSLADHGVVLNYIGRGARLAQTRAAAQGMTNVRFSDYRPLEELNNSLAACDVAALALEPAADGLAMPSKLGGILASGRPLLALVHPQGEIARLVETERIGLVADPFNDTAIREAILKLKGDAKECAAMGHRARQLAERRLGLEKATEAYRRLLRGKPTKK